MPGTLCATGSQSTEEKTAVTDTVGQATTEKIEMTATGSLATEESTVPTTVHADATLQTTTLQKTPTGELKLIIPAARLTDHVTTLVLEPRTRRTEQGRYTAISAASQTTEREIAR